MFAEKVVSIYNSLNINQSVINEHIELNQFLNGGKITDKRLQSSFRSYINTTLIPIRIYPLSKKYIRGKKPKLYYKEEDINNTFNQWIELREKLNRPY